MSDMRQRMLDAERDYDIQSGHQEQERFMLRVQAIQRKLTIDPDNDNDPEILYKLYKEIIRLEDQSPSAIVRDYCQRNDLALVTQQTVDDLMESAQSWRSRLRQVRGSH